MGFGPYRIAVAIGGRPSKHMAKVALGTALLGDGVKFRQGTFSDPENFEFDYTDFKQLLLSVVFTYYSSKKGFQRFTVLANPTSMWAKSTIICELIDPQTKAPEWWIVGYTDMAPALTGLPLRGSK